MDRRMLIVAVSSACLGILIGGLAVYVFGNRNPASSERAALSDRAIVFGEQFDGPEVLERAKPKDAKFIGSPGGVSQQTRYGYDGCTAALWEGTADPEAVKEIIFKDLESRFQAKKWETSRGGGGSLLKPGESLSWHELRYHSPGEGAGGWVRLFIHQQGQRVSVVLVFNTGRDWL